MQSAPIFLSDFKQMWGYAVAQLVAGSIPDGVIGIVH